MSLSISGALSAKASFEDGNWCGTPPGPHPHFDLGSSIFSKLEAILLNPQPLPPKAGAGGQLLDEFCGTVPKKLHLPPPPPPPFGEALGAVSHQVLNQIRGL